MKSEAYGIRMISIENSHLINRRSFKTSYRQIIFLLLFLLFFFEYATTSDTMMMRGRMIAPPVDEEADLSSFVVRLSEDTSSFHPQQEVEHDEMQIEDEVKVVDISEEDINRIYAKLPPIATSSDDKKEFHMREASLKPQINKVIEKTFPPKDETDPGKEEYNANEDLTIVRYSPENSVELASHITITFSHPMISVSTIDQINEQRVPVEITPKVEGKFRYVGTKTLLFEPEYRFPMSSIFTVEIPKGTKSAVGNELKETFTFKFTTPTATLKRNRVIGNTRKPFIFVEFDQDIDPVTLITFIRVKSNDDDHKVNFRLVDESDYVGGEHEKLIKGLIKSASSRYFIFVVDGDDLLPHDSQIRIIFQDQLPSKEGPLKTTKEQEFSFRTYGPLKFTRKADNGHPGDTLHIYFSNPLDESVNIDELITITPPIDDLRITWSNSAISFNGKTMGNTNYSVEVKKELKDIYGQSLAANEVIELHVKEAKAHLYAFRDNMVVLKPERDVSYSVIAVNLQKIVVTYFQVSPMELVEKPDWLGYDSEKPLENIRIGKKLETVSLPVPDYLPDVPIEVKIPLHNALTYPDENLGHVILCITTPDEAEVKVVINAYIQVTDIGISVFNVLDTTEFWATQLSTSLPLPNVKINTPIPIETDEFGIAKNGKGAEGWRYALASKEHDFVSFQYSQYYTATADQYFAYTTDDRKLYKPKEEVHVKGWIR